MLTAEVLGIKAQEKIEVVKNESSVCRKNIRQTDK